MPNIYCTYLCNELVVRGTHDPEVAKQAWDEVGFPLEELDWNDALPVYIMGVYSADPKNPEQLSWKDYAYRPAFDTIPVLLWGNNWPDVPEYFVNQYRKENNL